MAKFAWKGSVLEGKLEEYVRRHDAIWPEMVQVLKEAGVRNYTIWNTGDELFGYYECDDIDTAARIQAESKVVAIWGEYMKDVMIVESDPKTGCRPMLRQVFSLD